MTEIEKKKLIARLRARTDGRTMLACDPPRPAPDRDCHAAADLIEQHEAFRQEVSDALSRLFDDCEEHIPIASKPKLRSFIIAKPDPLVEAVKEASNPDYDCASPEAYAEVFRAALAARGLKIVWEDK